MKAITLSRYGSPDVLRLSEVPKPAPGPGEVLVSVRAASVNRYDWHLMTGIPYLGRLQTGLLRPKVSGLGSDFAGRVLEVGSGVVGLAAGDDVFGQVNGEVPGQPLLDLGAFAEYVAVSEASVVHKPVALSFEQAAAAPMAGRTALQALRDAGGLQPGQSVLINGGSGGVGTFAVQIAKAMGGEVTAVCSTRNVDLVRSLGADNVIDYAREDFTTLGPRFDLLLDNVGNHTPRVCRRVLRPTGTYVASFGLPKRRWIGPLSALVSTMILSRFGSQRMVAFVSKRDRGALLDLRSLMETGEVQPVIDRVYPLSEAATALRYMEEGHADGKIVITL